MVCGHIHQPEMREITTAAGKIVYLNSGDWIENLTALEYAAGKWELYKFNEEEWRQQTGFDDDEELDNSRLFDNMIEEFNLLRN